VALVTGSVLAQFGRPLQRDVLLGLLVGAFDFAMYLLQMGRPRYRVGWKPDILILAAAARRGHGAGRGGEGTAAR